MKLFNTYIIFFSILFLPNFIMVFPASGDEKYRVPLTDFLSGRPAGFLILKKKHIPINRQDFKWVESYKYCNKKQKNKNLLISDQEMATFFVKNSKRFNH